MKLLNSAEVTAIEYRISDKTFVCSFAHDPYQADIAISYKPTDYLLEYMEFETWIKSIQETEMLIEDLCRVVFDKVYSVLGDIQFCVEIDARSTVHAPVCVILKNEV